MLGDKIEKGENACTRSQLRPMREGNGRCTAYMQIYIYIHLEHWIIDIHGPGHCHKVSNDVAGAMAWFILMHELDLSTFIFVRAMTLTSMGAALYVKVYSRQLEFHLLSSLSTAHVTHPVSLIEHQYC